LSDRTTTAGDAWVGDFQHMANQKRDTAIRLLFPNIRVHVIPGPRNELSKARIIRDRGEFWPYLHYGCFRYGQLG
jgi:hypothetical protein